MKDHVLGALDVLFDIYDRDKEPPGEYAVKAVASD
jgi:hypothetical protein